jgi:hypothetical protein
MNIGLVLSYQFNMDAVPGLTSWSISMMAAMVAGAPGGVDEMRGSEAS